MDFPKLNVIPFERRHLVEAVQVHLDAFPSFFLSFLGPAFLSEFYRGFLGEKNAVALVAEDKDGKLRGIVVGTSQPDGFFRKLMIKRWWSFFFAGIGAVLRRPSITARLIQAVWYRGGAPAGESRALLSSIAVSPKHQGTGTGRLLVSSWLHAVRERGENIGCYLTTDAIGNKMVNDFYLRAGWKFESTYTTPQGRKMNQYFYDFK